MWLVEDKLYIDFFKIIRLLGRELNPLLVMKLKKTLFSYKNDTAFLSPQHVHTFIAFLVKNSSDILISV